MPLSINQENQFSPLFSFAAPLLSHRRRTSQGLASMYLGGLESRCEEKKCAKAPPRLRADCDAAAMIGPRAIPVHVGRRPPGGARSWLVEHGSEPNDLRREKEMELIIV